MDEPPVIPGFRFRLAEMFMVFFRHWNGNYGLCGFNKNLSNYEEVF
jgi:hypothetical protein